MSTDLQGNSFVLGDSKATEKNKETQAETLLNKSNDLNSAIKNKKKKPFIMVKTGILPISADNPTEVCVEDEESYVKTLLNDQSLVDTDIIKNRPALANNITDLMSNSGNSVVITPTTPNNTADTVKLIPVDFSDNASSTHNVNSNDMNYSDSDFESNLIGRLDKVNDDNISSTTTNSSDYSTNEVIVLNTSSDSDVSTTTSDDEDEADLIPDNPAMLDRSLHYAMQKFQGPESSHCPLEKNEECVVLNDEDVYWWLVRRVKDGRIGFVPGELLEGWNDKLAKWNTFINERQGRFEENELEKDYEEQTLIQNDNVTGNLSRFAYNGNTDKEAPNIASIDIDKNISNNSVKFDENVTYVPYDSLESVYSGLLHEELNLDDEFKSDVSWGSMPKLQIKKNGSTGNTHAINTPQYMASADIDAILQPQKPFGNAEYGSSPSIGEYSTSLESSQLSDTESSSNYSSNDENDENELHEAVRRQYDPLLAKMDDIIKRLK